MLVVLVTGRTLSALDALFCSPPPFDAIVAENGAVLRLPNLPSPIMLTQGPDLQFLAELHIMAFGISMVIAWSMPAPMLPRRS